MAGIKFLATLLLVTLAISLASAYGDLPTKKIEKKVEIVVEGMVYCQSCKGFSSRSLTGAKPLAAAKVSVICKDYKNRVNFYKVFGTDSNGYFYAELDGFNMSHSILEHPLKSCIVKLVSSPLKSCNAFSKINYGLNGASLRYENKHYESEYYDAVIYAAGPLAFRPATCYP